MRGFALLLALSAGCAPVTLYDGAERPGDQIAVVSPVGTTFGVRLDGGNVMAIGRELGRGRDLPWPLQVLDVVLGERHGDPTHLLFSAWVTGIDVKDVPWWGAQTFHVLPGPREVRLKLSDPCPRGYWSVERRVALALTFQAEPGQRYRLGVLRWVGDPGQGGWYQPVVFTGEVRPGAASLIRHRGPPVPCPR